MTATGREVLELRHRPAHQRLAEAIASRSGNHGAVHESAIRVVVADDDDRPRARLAAALRAAGIEVTEARDGAEALAFTSGSEPDVVILDWPMASGGLPLAERLIGEHGMSGRVIMLACAYDRRDHHAALKAGAQYVVRSPLPGTLVAAVRLAAGRTVGF